MVPWPELRGRATIVLKLSYQITAWGNAVLAERPDPLVPDTFSDAGVLLFPSDFVRMKERCDVLIVGRALTMPKAPTSLKVGAQAKFAEHVAALGPVAVLAGAAAVQHAPADQCLSLPVRLPLRFRYQRLETIVDGLVPGALPDLAIVRRGALDKLAPSVDTIAIDPDRRRVSVTLRASVDGIDLSDALLVVDESSGLPESFAREGATWPRTEVLLPPEASHASPVVTRVLAANETLIHFEAGDASLIDESTVVLGGEQKPAPRWDEEETTVQGRELDHTFVPDLEGERPSSPADSLPFQRSPAVTQPVSLTRAPSKTAAGVPLPRDKAATLPFVRRPLSNFLRTEETTQSTPPSSRARALPFAKSSPPPAKSLVDEQTADISQTGDAAPSAPRSVPLPWPSSSSGERRPIPEGATAATPFDRAGRAPTAQAPVRPLQATPAASETTALVARAPEPVATTSVPADKPGPGELTFQRYAGIRAELWAAKEPRGAILKRHGFSELRWRMAERTLSSQLGAAEFESAVAATLAKLATH